MDKGQLEQILPHRGPMLLMDSVELQENEAVGRVAIRGGEWFLQGHYPQNPVVPGVILCEMMAQTCCVLLGKGAAEGAVPYFTGLDKVRFRRPVRPGEVLCCRCRILRVKAPFYFAEGSGSVGDALAVSAAFSFALVPEKRAAPAAE